MGSTRLLLLFVLLAGALPFRAAAQQQTWPNRVVRIIATSPPGGAIDFLARTIAEEYAKAFGQPFIVENRPGANGNIGVELVLKAPADGHMLFVTAPGPFSINLNLYDSMSFHPATDIAPVTLLGVSPLVLVVHPSLPASSLKELLAFLRAQRGKVNYASQAIGSTGHLAMELLKSRARVEATHVPYKGSAAAATIALLSGEAAMSFVNTSASIPHIRTGRLRAIAVAEKQRIAAAPEIPTVSESGLPGFEATPWLGLGTRSGVARDIVNRLSEAAARALSRSDAVSRMGSLGIETRPMAPEQFADFVRAETVKWGDIIKRSGAKRTEGAAGNGPRKEWRGAGPFLQVREGPSRAPHTPRRIKMYFSSWKFSAEGPPVPPHPPSHVYLLREIAQSQRNLPVKT